MKTIVIIQYTPGNHTDTHWIEHGHETFRGNLREWKQEMKRMREWCRNAWYSSCTNDNYADFMAERLSNIRSFELTKDGTYIRR